MQQHTDHSWRKSSRSVSGSSNCVEVCHTEDVVAMRDSKDPDGPVLRFELSIWSTFVQAVKDGEFDL